MGLSIAGSVAALLACGSCGSQRASVEAASDAGDVDVATEPTTDASPIDAAPRNAGFPCIRDWPDYKAPTTPAPSLGGPRLALRGVEAPGHGAVGGPSVLSGGKLGVVGGNVLWSLDIASGQWSSYRQLSKRCQAVGPPTARPDAPGGFILGCIGVVALEPDFADAGGPIPADWGVVWRRLLGPDQSTSNETTLVSRMLVSPEGTLYFTATDGKMRAWRARDGSEIWAQPAEWTYGQVAQPSFGVGDRIFVGGKGYHRATGVSVGVPRVDGEEAYIWGTTYGRGLIATPGPMRSTNLRAMVLDECGKYRWSLPELTSYRFVIGFNDTLMFSTPQGIVVYSQDGDRLAGPGPSFPQFLALGGDGVAYYADCKRTGVLKLVAVAPDLTVLARLDVGGSCALNDGVLLDDGQLLISRLVDDGQGTLEVVRLATSSPGLAKTARPTIFRDNARTRWLSAW